MYFDKTTIVLLIILVASCLVAVFTFTQHYYLERIRSLKKLHESIKNFSAHERQRLKEGYIFASLWTIADIHRLAALRGMVLDNAEAIKVVSIVTENFKKSEGISEFTINMALSELAMDYKYSLSQGEKRLQKRH